MSQSDSVWLLALLCGFTLTFAVVGVPTGLGIFLFTNIVLGVLWYLYSKKDRKELLYNKSADTILKLFGVFYVILTIPYLYRLDDMVVSGIAFYHFLYIAVFSILGLYPALLTILNPLNMFIFWLSAGLNWFVSIFKTFASLLQLESSKMKFILKVVIYITISLVIFIVFVTLLSQADVNFRERILRILESIQFGEIVIRTFAGLIAVFIFAGAFRLVADLPIFTIIAAKKEALDAQLAKAKEFLFSKFSDAFLPLLVTVPIFFIFLLFVYLQFQYLFGVSIDQVLSTLTFSEYARKGFWELLLVVALTYPILAWVSNHTRTEKLLPRVINFIVSSSIVGFVYVMLYSAFTRMGIYSEIYGPSVRRNYVILAIIVLAIGITMYQIFAAIKVFKPHFRLLASQFFGDYVVLAAFIATSLLSAVALLPWNSITLQQIADKYEKTGSIDVYQIADLPIETMREVYIFADNLEKKYANKIQDGTCSADVTCPSFGIRFLKSRALIKKETYVNDINSSFFTRFFGLNFTGLQLEYHQTPPIKDYLSDVTKKSNEDMRSMVTTYVKAIERNDFATARTFYDPKMKPMDIQGFAKGVSLALDEDAVNKDSNSVSEMFGDVVDNSYYIYVSKYMTYYVPAQVIRSNPLAVQGVTSRLMRTDSIVMAQETPALIKPNTTEMLTVRVGIRNGKPVIVHSNIPLAYLPDAVIPAEGEFDYALREYGYETYCKVPTGALVMDSPDEICFSNYEPIKDLSSKDLLLDSKK